MKKILFGLAAAVLVMLSGCSTWYSMTHKVFGDGRAYVIHLHAFSTQRTEDNEMRAVEYIPGKFIYPEEEPIISSPNIKKIEVIQMPTGKSLKLVLDGHGRTVWTQASVRLRGKRLVIMVDDKYRGWIRLRRIEESGIVVLPGPFSDKEVKKILERADKNRKKF